MLLLWSVTEHHAGKIFHNITNKDRFPRDYSPIRPIFIPERARARRADWAPGPGVFVLFPPVARSLMCRAVIPNSCTCHTKVCYLKEKLMQNANEKFQKITSCNYIVRNLASLSNILCCKHSRIRRWLIPVSFNLHSTWTKETQNTLINSIS